jgi:nitrate/nitrite transporter NarK
MSAKLIITSFKVILIGVAIFVLYLATAEEVTLAQLLIIGCLLGVADYFVDKVKGYQS